MSEMFTPNSGIGAGASLPDHAFDATDFADFEFDGFNEPENRLWRSVVLQVWSDCFNVRRIAPARRTESDEARREAIRWLTLSFDPWREDRETVCSMAGISADMLRTRALERLNAERMAADAQERAERVAKVQVETKRGRIRRIGTEFAGSEAPAVLSLGDRFASLVAEAPDMSPEAVDAMLEELARLEAAA